MAATDSTHLLRVKALPAYRAVAERIEAAGEQGRLALLRWARAQAPPCPWDERTCTAAVRSGYLTVLQWARAQAPPCPWDERTCYAAAELSASIVFTTCFLLSWLL
jgi:hypothetical protein